MPSDERVCYSVGCSWWSSIHQAGSTNSGLPCCPFCGSVLMEMENEALWWHSVDQYALKTDDPDYPNFILWMRGKCFTSLERARDAYLSRT